MNELKALHEVLLERGLTVSTAESCTGGLVGAAMTALPGSSAYYLGGVVSYSNEVKEAVLSVPGEVLATVGAVSEETARAMAEGVKQLIGSHYGVATTGIAGPGGATATKPVGLVYVGISGPLGTIVKALRLAGSREEIRKTTVEQALQALLDMIMKETL